MWARSRENDYEWNLLSLWVFANLIELKHETKMESDRVKMALINSDCRVDAEGEALCRLFAQFVLTCQLMFKLIMKQLQIRYKLMNKLCSKLVIWETR